MALDAAGYKVKCCELKDEVKGHKAAHKETKAALKQAGKDMAAATKRADRAEKQLAKLGTKAED